MKVVINADDFGYSEMVTKAILEALQKGYVTQTTLMVNMPYADEAVALAKKNGVGHHIGLHLNVGEGYPITDDIKSCPLFCNADGSFNGAFKRQYRSNLRYALALRDKKALGKEIDAQISRYLDYELPLMHIDGHYHDHLRTRVFRMLASRIRKNKFRSIRKPDSISWFSQRGLELRAMTAWVKFCLLGSGIKMVDYFGGVDIFRKNRHLMPDDCIVELMVHPQYDRDGRLIDKDVRDGALCDSLEDVFGYVSEKQVTFITYGNLSS